MDPRQIRLANKDPTLMKGYLFFDLCVIYRGGNSFMKEGGIFGGRTTRSRS